MACELAFGNEIKDLCRDSHPATEVLRRSVLSGRRILIVHPAYAGKRAYYQRARELGIKLALLDGSGHWSQELVHEGIAEAFLEVDLSPSDTLFERALHAIRASGLPFDGVATFCEFALPLTARLAEALGLPGHDLRAVGLSRDKTLTRTACVSADIPSPRFARLGGAADLDAAARQVGFPAILKPASGAASIHAYRVEDEQSLRKRYAEIMESIKGKLKTQAVTSDDVLEMLWLSAPAMVLEEYLDGEEFDVDCLLSEDVLAYASVTRDLPQPQCKEVGAQIPPPFPDGMQDELVALAYQALRTLGFSDGVFHVELKYTSAGPRLIEVNARLGGGPVYRLNKLVWGVDLVEQYLMTVIGLPIRPQKAVQPLMFLAESDLPCPYSGTVVCADFLNGIANDPRVVECKTYVEAGQCVEGPENGSPDWLGQVVVRGDTIEAASQGLAELIGTLEVPIIPATDASIKNAIV